MTKTRRPPSPASRMILWALTRKGDVVYHANSKSANASDDLYERVGELAEKAGVETPPKPAFRAAIQYLRDQKKIEVLAKGRRSYAIRLLVSGSLLGADPYVAPEVPAIVSEIDAVIEEARSWSLSKRAELASALNASIADDLESLRGVTAAI